MKKLKIIISIVISYWLLCPLHSSASDVLNLTKEQKAWISSNPTIIVGNEIDWPPFDYAEDGIAKGYSVDLMRLIAKKAGLGIEFVNGYTWQQLMQKFKAGEIDVMPAIYLT